MTKNPTVREIVKNHLEKNNFDGLFCDDCGCPVDDLFTCGLTVSDTANCQAGHIVGQIVGQKEGRNLIGAKDD